MSIITKLHLEPLHMRGVAELINDNTVVIPIMRLSPKAYELESFSVEKRIRITYIPRLNAYTYTVYYFVSSDKESIECSIITNTVPLRIALEFLWNNPTHY